MFTFSEHLVPIKLTDDPRRYQRTFLSPKFQQQYLDSPIQPFKAKRKSLMPVINHGVPIKIFEQREHREIN